MIRDLTYTEKRALWERARASPLALKAAQDGIAWSLKCAVLHDGRAPDTIDMRDLKFTKSKAEQTALDISTGESLEWRGLKIGVIAGEARMTALTMWAKLEANEIDTADEIRRHQGRAPQARHVEAFA